MIEMLPTLLKKLSVKSLIDAPCGDFNWMACVDLGGIDYLGVDIDEDHLNKARERAGMFHRFEQRDILAGELPRADAVLCRDYLQHLPNELVFRAIVNLSSGKWLLATSHRNEVNHDIGSVGDFRQLNLMAPPFNFPPPEAWLEDSGRVLGAWAVNQSC